MKKRWLIRGALAVLVLSVLGALVVVSGIVPIKASSGHWKITKWFLNFAKMRSVSTHSIGIDPPALDDPRLVLKGAGHYELGCRPCHGAPGQRLPPIAQHMLPVPPDLAHHHHGHSDPELFSLVKHGIKLTGMPAWPATARDDEVWAVVAFTRKLPTFDREGYRRLVFGTASEAVADAPAIVVQRCARCHGVDGLARSEGAFPRLAFQRAEYLRLSLDAYANGPRQSGIMQTIAATMTDDEIDTIVRWYSERPPASGGPLAAGSYGEAIAQHGIPERRIPACAGCHGPMQKPHHPAYPRLAGQFAPYIEEQLRLFTNGTRAGGKFVELMKEAVTDHSLDPNQMAAVAGYYAALPGDR